MSNASDIAIEGLVNEIRRLSNQNDRLTVLVEKWMDRYLKMEDEISRLRSENSYLKIEQQPVLHVPLDGGQPSFIPHPITCDQTGDEPTLFDMSTVRPVGETIAAADNEHFTMAEHIELFHSLSRGVLPEKFMNKNVQAPIDPTDADVIDMDDGSPMKLKPVMRNG